MSDPEPGADARSSLRGAERPESVPGWPGDPSEPVFRFPWEAQAFAMAVKLHERGVFSWSEWAEALAAQIQQAKARGEPDLGESYYQHWLAALEAIVAEKGAATPGELERYRQGWARAAERTPHGMPIELLQPDLGE